MSDELREPIQEVPVARCGMIVLRKRRIAFFETILEVVAVDAGKRICNN